MEEALKREQGMTRTVFVRLAALLTLLVLLAQTAWALSMPGFRGPDEPHHVNSILRLAEGGGWPTPGEPMLDQSFVDAGKEAGMLVSGAESFVGLARTRLDNDRLTPQTQAPFRTYFRNIDVVPHDERSVLSFGQPSIEVDQMTQHPPLYYAGGAIIVTAFDLDEQPWDRLLLALRLYGIALTIPLVPSLIYSARRLGARRPWALAAGFIPFGIPQLFAITGGVTNDSLAIGLGALVVAALVKAGTEKITWKTVAVVGGSLGLALWTKGLLLAFGLALILIFALKKEETWKTRIIAILASGTGALLIGWWWALNIIRYGVIQPSGFVRSVPPDWDPSMAEFAGFASQAARSVSTSFFSAFGWLESDFHPLLTLFLTSILITGLGIAIYRGGAHRKTLLAVLAPVAGTLLLLFAESWSTYQDYGMVAGVQGRYFFPFVAIFAATVLGLRRFGGRAIVLFAAYNLTVGAYGFIFFLASAYPGDPRIDFARYSEVTGIGETALTALMVVLILALIGAFSLAAVIGLHDNRAGTAETPAEQTDNDPLRDSPTEREESRKPAMDLKAGS